VHRVCLLTWLALLACTDRAVDTGASLPPVDSSPAPTEQANAGGRELIPAEWTVFEDTSATGEITTASLQLPAAKDINGLLDAESPRLLLRCVDGRVQLSIDTQASDALEPVQDSAGVQGQTVEIRLDSAPACE
jgi:hypothetical protein